MCNNGKWEGWGKEAVEMLKRYLLHVGFGDRSTEDNSRYVDGFIKYQKLVLYVSL